MRFKDLPTLSVTPTIYHHFVCQLCTTGCIKKTEQIRNRSQRREAAQTIKFMIKIDCLGTYDVE